VLASSGASPFSIADRRVLQAAATNSVLQAHQDSSRAQGAHAPSILHAPALPVPADPALQAHARDLALVPDSVRHAQAFREPVQVAVPLLLEKLRDRNAPRIIEVVAAANSIPRRRKAQ
jgi:hypothetical protein